MRQRLSWVSWKQKPNCQNSMSGIVNEAFLLTKHEEEKKKKKTAAVMWPESKAPCSQDAELISHFASYRTYIELCLSKLDPIWKVNTQLLQGKQKKNLRDFPSYLYRRCLVKTRLRTIRQAANCERTFTENVRERERFAARARRRRWREKRSRARCRGRTGSLLESEGWRRSTRRSTTNAAQAKNR